MTSSRQGFFAALHYPNFRYFWFSRLGGTLAMWMEMVVVSWLVLEMTNSPALVGSVVGCVYVGMVLGPFFGSLADRFNRRRLLIIARIARVAYTLTLSVSSCILL